MTTALATISDKFPALVPDSRTARIIESNLDGEPMRESDLVHVSTPAGGATKWTIDVDGNEETVDEIAGLLLSVSKKGALWPSNEPTEKTKPVLMTRDLVTAYRVGDDLGTVDPKALEKFRTGDRTYDWAALSASPEFGYGAAGGAGKRVKESRELAILREGDTWPIIVSIGPGSLRGFLPFLKRLPTFHYECIIGLRLERAKSTGGVNYSMVIPRLIGTISEEQGEIARRLYTEPLKAMFSQAPASTASAVDAEPESESAPF